MIKQAKKRKKKKPSLWQKCDWTTLTRGDVVKTVQGHGPYILSSKGVREFMGYSGTFRVSEIDGQGVHCYDVAGGGHCYLIMVSGRGVGDIIREPHKLLKKTPLE